MKIKTYKNHIYLPIKYVKEYQIGTIITCVIQGKTRMYKTLASTMYWEGIEKDINTNVKNVPSGKNIKRNTKSKGNYHLKIVL